MGISDEVITYSYTDGYDADVWSRDNEAAWGGSGGDTGSPTTSSSGSFGSVPLTTSEPQVVSPPPPSPLPDVHEAYVHEGIRLALGESKLSPLAAPSYMENRGAGPQWGNILAVGDSDNINATVELGPGETSAELFVQDFGIRLPPDVEVVGVEIEVERSIVSGSVSGDAVSAAHCAFAAPVSIVHKYISAEFASIAVLNDGSTRAYGNGFDDVAALNGGLTGVVAVSMGNEHALALLSDGTVRAYTNQIAEANGEVSAIDGTTGAAKISAGGYKSAVLLADGSIVAAGRDLDGEITAINGMTGVKDVSVPSHTLVLLNDGTVRAFGDDGFGQVSSVDGMTGVKKVRGTGDRSAVILEDGTLRVFGRDNLGQLGIDGITGVVDVSLDYGSTVALLEDGSVRASGAGGYGADIDGLTGVQAIAAGFYHSLALLNDGTVQAVGMDIFGGMAIDGLTGVGL